MKILVQTNKRQHHQLEHEFKKLEESGFEIIPFGYYLSEDSKSITFTGLDDFDTSTPFVLRANIEVLRFGFCGSFRWILCLIRKCFVYNV